MQTTIRRFWFTHTTMTQRLYYHDSYQTQFDATLAGVTTVNGQPALWLDQTYFYPTSGGQPFDTGTLAGARVVDVVVSNDGQILHLVDALPVELAVGTPVQGTIDWPRRYDHMQQHSGQHLLSQLFYRHFGWETVAVHFGDHESTLDLDVAAPELAQLEEAERLANDLVYAALPIRAYFVTDAELPTVSLRRPPKVTGQIRIVEIDAFDYSACGGTHVRTTAEIGPIKLVKLERRRGQARITFLCGKRAYADYAAKHRLLNEAAALFSTDMAEVPKLVERNLAQLKELQRALDAATEQLLRHEAAELAAGAEEMAGVRLVAHLFADRPSEAVKGLASQLGQQPHMVALLATTAGNRLTLVVARAADVNLHAGNLLRGALETVGGKGGGRPEFAQGGVADPSVGEQVLTAARTQVERYLTQLGD
jgi:alanyl-tRNA synthetase